MKQVDVAIVGGGMVGASLALALSQSELRVVLIEAAVSQKVDQPSFDERSTALGNASRRIFEGLGVWSAIARHAAAIRHIHVSDAGRPGIARLEAREQDLAAFGYVVSNRIMGEVLWDALRGVANVELLAPARLDGIDIQAENASLQLLQEKSDPITVQARLVIAADGAQSRVRAAAGISADVVDYQQVAIVTQLATERPHCNVAYERFTPAGPMALLPHAAGGYGAVWTVPAAQSATVLAYDNVSFLNELQTRFGWRAGRFLRTAARAAYPLQLTRARALTAHRVVLIGNAAQALHPVAGQGFNLGLRDAALLAEVLARHKSIDPGASQTLREYAQMRAADRHGVIRFTDGLIRLFGTENWAAATARSLGLLMFDMTPAAKRALARVSLGFAGPAPRLARSLSIR